MTKLIVDGIEVDVPPEYTLLQACEAAGAEIPRFCFHERLSIAGNCRMCLVELKGAPKPVASCAWGVRDCRPGPERRAAGGPDQVADGQEGARRGDGVPPHQPPARLPDLRPGRRVRPAGPGDGLRRRHDAATTRTSARCRTSTSARWSKTTMNRCIHCTRCIRFTTEVAGVADLGAIGRGEDMEITTYLETAMRLGAAGQRRRPLPGRRADVTSRRSLQHAPVGAVEDRIASTSWTRSARRSASIPAAARSCASCRAINEAVNEEWISDKTRQVVDGLRLQRLDRPYVRDGGRLRPATWPEAFAAIAARVKGTDGEAHRRHRRRSRRRRGDVRAEAPDASLGVAKPRLPPGRQRRCDPRFGRASYLFNPTIAGIERRRRDPDRRREPAHRGVAAQCAHPQALAHGAAADRR